MRYIYATIAMLRAPMILLIVADVGFDAVTASAMRYARRALTRDVASIRCGAIPLLPPLYRCAALRCYAATPFHCAPMSCRQRDAAAIIEF